MAKKSALQALCEAFEVKQGKPVSKTSLAKAEAQLGGPLPKAVREFYETCDGGEARHDRSTLQLHPLKAALDYGRVPKVSRFVLGMVADRHE